MRTNHRIAWLVCIWLGAAFSCSSSSQREMEELCRLATDLEKRCLVSMRQRIFLTEALKIVESDTVRSLLEALQHDPNELRYPRFKNVARLIGIPEFDCPPMARLFTRVGDKSKANAASSRGPGTKAISSVEFLCQHAHKYASEVGAEAAQSFLCNTVFSAEDKVDIHVKRQAAELCINLAWGSMAERRDLMKQQIKEAALGDWSCPDLEHIFEIDQDKKAPPLTDTDVSNDGNLLTITPTVLDPSGQPPKPESVPSPSDPEVP